MHLIDISRPLHAGAPHWPGDTPTDFALTARIADLSSCNVGRLSLSVHNGTHADAPFHFQADGATIDRLDLARFVGPARVIDARGAIELAEDLFTGLSPEALAATPRVLFRTETWADPTVFPPSWPLLSPTLPVWLAARGVTLVGLDVPSVDALASRDLRRHHQLQAAGILILENLDLRDVDAGVYELLALPLRIEGGDASPVRAVLRKS